MKRGFLVCVACVALWPTSVLAVDVAAESAQIGAAFSQALRDGAGNREAYPKALAERNAALTKLAETAEAEKSSEHLALARVYSLLLRYDDAARQAAAAVAAKSDDFAAHAALVQALNQGGKGDAADAAFAKLLALDVNDTNAAQFVGTTLSALSAIVGVQSAAGKFDAAEKSLSLWQAKVDAIQSDDEAVKSALDRSKQTLALLKSRIASERKRAALIGQAYFPLENPTWLNGSALAPEELRGKVVLLDFWAVWCGPCIATFPHLIEWHDKYADKGLVIIGVTKRYQYDWDAEAKRPKRAEELEPEKEDAATTEFAKHHGLKHRLAVLTDSTASQQYAVTGIPQAVLIDQTGTIRLIKVGSGEANAQALESEIRKLLAIESAAASK